MSPGGSGSWSTVLPGDSVATLLDSEVIGPVLCLQKSSQQAQLHDFSKSCVLQSLRFRLGWAYQGKTLYITVRTVCEGQVGACAASEVPANSGGKPGASVGAVQKARRTVAPASFRCSFAATTYKGRLERLITPMLPMLECGTNAAVTKWGVGAASMNFALHTEVHGLPTGPCRLSAGTMPSTIQNYPLVLANMKEALHAVYRTFAWPDHRHQRLVSDVSRRRNSSGLPRLSRRCRSCPAGVLSSGAACVTAHGYNIPNRQRAESAVATV